MSGWTVKTARPQTISSPCASLSVFSELENFFSKPESLRIEDMTGMNIHTAYPSCNHLSIRRQSPYRGHSSQLACRHPELGLSKNRNENPTSRVFRCFFESSNQLDGVEICIFLESRYHDLRSLEVEGRRSLSTHVQSLLRWGYPRCLQVPLGILRDAA